MTEKKLGKDFSKMNIETSGIVPKTPKNWNDLPPEIKLECIEFLNFKERNRLRQTSHTEKCLVDALRYDFNYVSCAEMDLFLHRRITREHYSIQLEESEIWNILKHSNIGELVHSGRKHTNNNEPGLIEAKRFFSVRDFDSAKEFVKKLWAKTEMISLDLEEKRISIDEFMDIPQIKKVPDLRLECANSMQVVPLIQKWLEIDKESESKLKIDCEQDCSDELAAKFEFQKISPTICIGNRKRVIFEFDYHWRFIIYCTVNSVSE